MPQLFDFKILTQLRKKKRLTIESLAKRAGLSYSAVADIERNKVTPNLDTLHRIAGVLGYCSSDLLSLAEGKQAQILKSGEPVRANGFDMSVFTLPDIRLISAHAPEAYSSDAKLSTHPNFTELLYIVDGTCKVVIEKNEYVLNKGELIRFDGFQQHYYEALEDNTRVILIHQNK